MILKETILFLFMPHNSTLSAILTDFNLVLFDYIFLLCYVASLSTSLTMYHVDVTLCQAVQVLLSMKIHRLANTPIQYRYILANLTIFVIRVSIIREIEMYTYAIH